MEYELLSLEAILGRIWTRLNLLNKGTIDFDIGGNSPKEIIADIERNVSYYPASDVIAGLDSLLNYINRIIKNHKDGWKVPKDDVLPDMWTDDEITVKSKDELCFYQQEISIILDFVSAQGCAIPTAAPNPHLAQSKHSATGLKLLPDWDEELIAERIIAFVESLVRHKFIEKTDGRRTEKFFKGLKVDKIKWLMGLSTLRELIILLTEGTDKIAPSASSYRKWIVAAENFTDNGAAFTPRKISGSNQTSECLEPHKLQLLRSLQHLIN